MEMNINIEGYNVNGICVGCLNYNRYMFYDSKVQECFKLVANIDVPDGLTIQVCSICLAETKSVLRFRQQIIKSFEVLTKYSKQHTFLNCPSDLSQHATNRLSVCWDESAKIKIDGQTQVEFDVSVVKSEVDENLKPEVNYDDIQEEDLKMEEQKQFDDIEFGDDLLSHELDVTSEDDIQLSKLKKKRDRKSKKRKKNEEDIQPTITLKKDDTLFETRIARKLKNLPEDIVEVYTMDEDEMWQVRAEDIDNKEFARLKYKCMNCIIEFNSEKLMKDHMAGKHKPKSGDCAQCDVCKSYLLTKDKLSTHRSLHRFAFRCKQCMFRSAVKRVMARHVRTQHADGHYKCSTCEATFSTKSKLTYHRTTCEQEKPQCDCCGKVFASKMTLRYHLSLKTSKSEKPKEKLYIPCKGCNKIFTSKKSYRAHVVIHDGQTYPCPICGKLFQWKRNLARHTRNHRERDAGALHECRECGKTFSSRDCYNNHMKLSKRHVGVDAYVHECHYCGKKFATKWCMVDHIDWDHLKRIKYQCSVCFKAFKTAKIMVAHMNNIHEGKKNREPEGEHLCEICGKSYKTVKRLKGHVWAMHTNRSSTKSFKCKLCPATFTWQTSIYKHVKMMHDTNKRNKVSRPSQLQKKPEPYPGIELANRMQYFQQNIANNLVQNLVQPPNVGLVQNIV